MLLLGFADDVLDLPWRYKLLLPTVASLPLLFNYHANYGNLTTIIIPQPFRWLLAYQDGSNLTILGTLLEIFLGKDAIHIASGARIVDLGLWYLLYMGLLAVFATNAINIYAGINGLEAGQSFIISIAILTANIYELANGAINEHAYHHLLAIRLGIPFIGTAAGILYYNVYPAKIFVGDTFCYFAGMTFAVMGILGHFSKTLLLFLLPQIFNFIYSLPQLFKIYPCPRHRLPQYDAKLNIMKPSTFTIEYPNPLYNPKDKQSKSIISKEYANMTLINLILRIMGPMSERNLTNILLGLQVLTCSLGLFIRYYIDYYFFQDHKLKI